MAFLRILARVIGITLVVFGLVGEGAHIVAFGIVIYRVPRWFIPWCDATFSVKEIIAEHQRINAA